MSSNLSSKSEILFSSSAAVITSPARTVMVVQLLRKLSRCDFDPFLLSFFCCCWARQQCHFSRSFILSDSGFIFRAALGINRSTLFVWSSKRDQRIRSLFRIAKLYKTWFAETACSAT